MNPIIIYYSRSGNTEKVAKKVQAEFECPLVKIEPEEAYGNYVISCLRVMKDNVRKYTPAFITPVPDLTEYDTVFIGYPIWAQDMPAFVAEFVRQCNLKGKTVIPFATYGMTSISWTMKTVNQICDGADVQCPFSTGVLKKQDFNRWIEEVRALKHC